MGVTGPQGIVGSVINVSENFAIVMSMLHPQFRVVAKLKKGGETGTIDWDGISPTFRHPARHSQKRKSGRRRYRRDQPDLLAFPANLMVGTIEEIVPDNTSQFLYPESQDGDQFLQY